MTLNEYMRKHFFDRCKPYKIVKEDETELNIGWDDTTNMNLSNMSQEKTRTQ